MLYIEQKILILFIIGVKNQEKMQRIIMLGYSVNIQLINGGDAEVSDIKLNKK